MLYSEKRKTVQTIEGRRETIDRRRYEILGVVLAVLAGQFLSKRRRERRKGWDRRARPSPMHH